MTKNYPSGVLLALLLSTSNAFATGAGNDLCSQGADYKMALAEYSQGDYTSAAQSFETLANAGDPCGQYWLGELYHWGQGVPQDDRKANELLKASADQGFSMAMAVQLAGGFHWKGK